MRWFSPRPEDISQASDGRRSSVPANRKPHRLVSLRMLEFRLALRLLRKQPVVTLTTLFALTIGIGMATTGFTLLDSVLYSKLPYPNGDRFVLVNAHPPSRRPNARQSTPSGSRSSPTMPPRSTTWVRSRAAPSISCCPLARSCRSAAQPDAKLGEVFPYTPVLGRTLRSDDGLQAPRRWR